MTMLIAEINKITQKQYPSQKTKMKPSYKTSPKKIIDQIKKRRQTINFTQSEYNLPEKIKSPKTEKKQSYFNKDFKPLPKYQKSHKILYTEIKKSSRTNSLTPYQTDLTPKKILQYHIDSSESKQRPLRKIHSISLVDTPKKLNLKKKTQQHLFTVKEQLNKDGCKKVVSSYKIPGKSYSKPLRIESTNRAHESMEGQDAMVGMRSSKKMYCKNSENYDIYYNEGNHQQHSSNNMQNVSNSSSQLRSSKKVRLPQSNCHNSSIAMEKQKSSSRTLRITRNSRSSNHGKEEFKKNISNINMSSKNNTKSQNGMKSPRVQEFEVEGHSSEKKFEQMFFKCSLILKKYNNELEKLRGQNESLLRENEYLKSSLSQRRL